MHENTQLLLLLCLSDGVFFFLSSPPKYVNNFLKRKRKTVISAFISSNTGELVNNIFQVFHKNYRQYFRDKKPEAHGSSNFLKTFHTWGVKKRKEEEEISFYFAFLCSLFLCLLNRVGLC